MTAIAPKTVPLTVPPNRPLISTPPSALRLMLDSADSTEWERWLPTGMLYGITTNPLLLERSQVPCRIESLKALALKAMSLGAQEVQLQAWGSTVATYLETGAALAAID